MASVATICLSKQDSSVLGALFDAEASLQKPSIIQTDLPEIRQSDSLLKIKQLERQALLSINEENPSLANIQKSIDDLSSIITTYPSYASAWNNRAQATRMLFELADAPSHVPKIRSVYDDLSKAIELSTPTGTSMTIPASVATVLSSAHTHRGYIMWFASRPEAAIGMLDAVVDLRGMDKGRLEELASREFALGGRYGNQTAQRLAVKINPYARLCGSIVREAMQKEISEYQGQRGTAV